VHRTAPREVIGSTLAELAAGDPRVVVLDADLGRSTRLTPFERRFPDRYIQLGVAEQNAIGVATGLAYAGLRPVFVTFAMFAVGLPWTQLRQAAYAGVGFTVVGTHPGLDVGPDGGTHQMLEDLALARVIPELTVLSPCDRPETVAALTAAVASGTLVYVRVGRHPVPDLHDAVDGFPFGAAEILLDAGRDCVIVTDGSMAATAVEAAAALHLQGAACCIVNIRSIKPLDVTLLRELAAHTQLMVTVENHSIIGGLGSAVAEAVADLPCTVVRLGMPDAFGTSGTAEALRAHFCLDATGVAASIKTALDSKTRTKPSLAARRRRLRATS
jgi:transketolase